MYKRSLNKSYAGEKRFIDVSDACNRYSLGRSTIRAYAESVGAVRKIGRRVLIDTEAVDRALGRED